MNEQKQLNERSKHNEQHNMNEQKHHNVQNHIVVNKTNGTHNKKMNEQTK